MISQRVLAHWDRSFFLCTGILLPGCKEKNETNLPTTSAAPVEVITDSNVIEVSRPDDFP